MNPEFVGREAELAVLRGALAAAVDGRGGGVLIAGEPGVGKTRLLGRLIEDAAGFRVLQGRAYETEGLAPYLPLAEAIAGLTRDEYLDAAAGKEALLALVSPELRRGLNAVPADGASRYEVFEAVAGFFVELGKTSPLLLCLDDLHWTDGGTLLLLRHLLRRVQDAPVLVLGTYRTVELGRGHPLLETLAEIEREQLAGVITLLPFEAGESARIVESIAGALPGTQTLAALQKETGGNAFFLVQLVQDLLASGIDLSAADGVRERRGAPRSVRQVLSRRFDRLSLPARRLLEAAAVCGDGFQSELAAWAADIDLGRHVDAIEEAILAGLVRDGESACYFVHPLIRTTLLEEMSTARRREMHRRIFAATEEEYGSADDSPALGELAWHAAQSYLKVLDTRALDLAKRAARRASRLLAFEEASDLLDLALTVAERVYGVDLVAHYFLAADAAYRAARFTRAMQHYARVVSIANKPEQVARAAIAYEDAMLASGTPRGRGDRSIELLESGLRAIGDGDPVLRSRLLAGLARARFFGGDPEAAGPLSEEAVDLARQSADLAALAYALNSRRIAIWGPDRLEERLTVATELTHLAAQIGDQSLRLESRQWRVIALLEAGRGDEFDAESAAFIREAEESHEPYWMFKAGELRAMTAGIRGDFAFAGEFARSTMEAGRRSGREVMALDGFLALYGLRAVEGRPAEMLDEMVQMEWEFPILPIFKYFVLKILCDQGMLSDARIQLDRISATPIEALRRDYFVHMILWAASESAVALGDRDYAAAIYPHMLPYRDRIAGQLPVCAGPLARPMGKVAALLGLWKEAEEHFETALALSRRIRSTPFAAHTQIDLARMLLARPGATAAQIGRAKQLATEAEETYRALNLPAVEDARRLLADPRLSRAPAARPGYPGNLSEREVEVLRLVARGSSNRAIADVLVLSERTVERHVAKIYDKIDIHTRAEAAAFAMRHRLI